MVRGSHLGWSREATLAPFQAMRGFRSHVLAISEAHFPQNPEYRALHGIVEAIDAAAEQFGRAITDSMPRPTVRAT